METLGGKKGVGSLRECLIESSVMFLPSKEDRGKEEEKKVIIFSQRSAREVLEPRAIVRKWKAIQNSVTMDL